MTDEDKALVERVAMLPDGNAWPSTVELLCDLRDRIEAQAAEIEKLRDLLREVTPPPHFGESEQSKANHGGSRPAQPWGKRND